MRTLRSGDVLARFELPDAIARAELALDVRKTRRSVRLDVRVRAAGTIDRGVVLGTHFTYGERAAPDPPPVIDGVTFDATDVLRALAPGSIELVLEVHGPDDRELTDEEILVEDVRLELR